MFGHFNRGRNCDRHAMAREAMRGRHGGFFGGFEGGWDEQGQGGRGGRGGRRRVFDNSELRLVLLKLIADEPRHGYELIKAIEELTGGSYAPSPGVVYPTLTLLQDMGQITEQANEGSKRLFAVTDAGLAIVEEQAALIEALLARLTSLGEEREAGDRSPVRRAMMNLHMAVRGRMWRGAKSADLAHQVASILDEAVQKIERL